MAQGEITSEAIRLVGESETETIDKKSNLLPIGFRPVGLCLLTWQLVRLSPLFSEVVSRAGLEPATHWLKERSSRFH
jgi:hypothetical protein